MKFSVSIGRPSEPGSFGLHAIWEAGSKFELLSAPGILLHQSRIALANVLSAPLTSLLTAMTAAVALGAFALVLTLLLNVQRYVVEANERIAVTIFLKDGTAAAASDRLSKEVASSEFVRDVKYIDKQAALDEFKAALGPQSGLAEGLGGNNPLPESLQVSFKDGVRPPASLMRALENDAAVDFVQLNQSIFDQAFAVSNTFKIFAISVIVLCLALCAFVIGSTIKLGLYAHRSEIEIMRLIGARNEYIRGPYLIEGAVQGLLGAGGGMLLSAVLVLLAQRRFESDPALALVFPRIGFLPWSWILIVSFIGTAMGLLGSASAARRFQVE